jgi:hypothetical protein
MCCYLLLAYALTWKLWAHPAARVPATGQGGVSADIFLSAWFMRYAAMAVSHGRLPALVTAALNAPHGVNVMWNTSILLPGVVLAPLTLLAGPFLSLNVMLTLGFAGSAATMCIVLRRWGAGLFAAAVGGALFGFSPALRMAAQDHYHLQFAVLIPLIIDAALRLATGRGRPLRTGAWLGLLMSAQFFIAEEMLVDSAIAFAIIVAVLAASRPALVWARIRVAAAGYGTALGLLAALCGYALWIQLHGPLAETGSPWAIGLYGNQPADFVTAPPAMLLNGGHFRLFLASTQGRLVESFSYLGWPLLAVMLAATTAWWRDLRIRAAGLTFFTLELLSMGGHGIRIAGRSFPPNVLPWHWLERLPVLSQVLPNRLSILADGAAAAVLAFALARTLAAAPARPRWLRPAVIAAAAAALLPLVPLSVPIERVQPPSQWASVLASLRLAPGASVLQLPLTGPKTMVWQALAGADISIVGGYCITPAINPPGIGRAAPCDTHRTLTADEQTAVLRLNALIQGRAALRPPSRATMMAALAGWRPAAVLTGDGDQAPLRGYLLRVLGPPTVQQGQVLGWRLTWLDYEPGGPSTAKPR